MLLLKGAYFHITSISSSTRHNLISFTSYASIICRIIIRVKRDDNQTSQQSDLSRAGFQPAVKRMKADYTSLNPPYILRQKIITCRPVAP
jgi:hypothetical protein